MSRREYDHDGRFQVLNERRHELIDRKLAGSLIETEESELAEIERRITVEYDEPWYRPMLEELDRIETALREASDA